jgi:hypothetical protein
MYKKLHICAKISLSIVLMSVITSCNRQNTAIGTREGDTKGDKQSLPCQLANSIDKNSSDNSHVSGAIFVDASGSMAGYVNSSGSKYADVINSLDSIFDPQQTKYFSFDSTAKSINRDTFFESARQPSFYQGKDSKIDLAIDSEQGHKSSLVVVVTDLEQDKGDVNRIVQKLATYIQKPNSAVGLIGIKSNFNGTVYNLNNSHFSYSKERPFYLLAIGNEAEVTNLIGKIKKKFEKSAQTLIFRHQLPGDELAYLKVPGAKVESLRGKLSIPQSLQQDIRIERGDQPIELLEIDKRAREPLTGLNYQLQFSEGEDKTVPALSTNRVQVTKVLAYDPKTKKMEENTTATKALKLNLTQQGKTATVNVTIDAQDLPVGMYYMTADLPTTGLMIPNGWKDWHQDINKSRNNDGSKTMGLLDFIDSLGNKVSEQQRIAGRLCFAIQRN